MNPNATSKHPSYGSRPVPTMQLLANLSKFNGNRADSIVNAKPPAPALNNTFAAPNSQGFNNNGQGVFPAPAPQRPETEEINVLDPHAKPATVVPQAELDQKHRFKYNSHMNSSVGKILHEKNEITPDDVSMPAKRMTGTRVSNMNNSLIGGQAPQGDPYLTTAQMMNSGEGTEKKLGSKKKILNQFQPELFVSPITGEQIADYGTWVDDIKNKTVKPKEEPEEDPYKNDPIMGKLKAQLSMRGAKGIIGLGRLFKIMDDDRSNSLSFAEFKKAMKDFGMVLNDTELVVLFKRFDISKSGAISYNDFLTTIAGSLNNRRRTLVNLAYDVLDKDGSGEIDISDIAMAYDASKHPDVVSGKRTTEQVLIEFLDGFDVGGTKDGKVTREEFERYYVTISASIDRDDYFELMIRNAWHISGGEGAAANSSNLRVLAVLADGTQTVVEVKNDLGLNKKDKNAILARLKAQGVNAINISTFDGGDDNQKGGPKPPPSRAGSRAGQRSAANPNSPNRKNRSNTNDAVNRSAEPSAGLKLIIAKIKQEMKSRGSGGFVGLQRRFKIMDDDGSKSLSISEFKKALKEFKMDISESDYRLLFDHFDRDQSGTIDFEEFVQGVRDPLNDKRLALVHLAFSVLDKDGSGIVDGQEIASMYDASKHPEVMAKRRTAAQVLREFLDTFDVGGVKDGKVTREEFVNYYTNIGASIENDEYFELMIRNAWHLNGGEGAAGNSTNMKVLITNTKGQEVTVALNNDLGVKKDDIPKIYARLRSQGVTDIYAIFGKVIKVLNINGVDVVTIQGETSSLNNDTAVAPNVLRAPPISRSRPQTAGGRVGSSTPMQRPVAGADSMPMGGANANNLRTNTTALAGNVVSQLKHQRESNAKKTADNIIGNTLLDVLRVQLLSRGTAGIIDLQRKFVEMDSDGSKSLDIGEFRAALLNNNMSFSDEQIESLFNYLDRDHSGFIDYQELLEGVRGPINPKILVLIHQAFDRMDQFGQNAVDPQQMILNFDASRHPDVSAGARTADDVMREFMETFDVGGVKPGKITRDEFVNYFHNISATTNEDDYMELIIRRTWRLGEDPVVVKQQQQVLLQEFQDQQRQLAATTRPSSRNGLGDNNVSSRIRNAQTFGQEHWNGNNNGAMAAPRPSTAGATRNRSNSNAGMFNQTQGNPYLQATQIQATQQRPLSARGSGIRQNFNATAPAHMQNGNLLNVEDELNAYKKEAVVQYNAGDFVQAEALFRQVLEIVQSMYPPNHPECIKAEKSIMLVQRKAQSHA